jgi:hypothetical protein
VHIEGIRHVCGRAVYPATIVGSHVFGAYSCANQKPAPAFASPAGDEVGAADQIGEHQVVFRYMPILSKSTTSPARVMRWRSASA